MLHIFNALSKLEIPKNKEWLDWYAAYNTKTFSFTWGLKLCMDNFQGVDHYAWTIFKE